MEVEANTVDVALPDSQQRIASRIVGAAYLITNLNAFFEVFYVSARLIDRSDGAKTAANILAHERLFRLGVAADLLTFTGLVVLVIALYTVLRTVNSRLVLLGAAWRVVETGIMIMGTAGSLFVLRLLKAHGLPLVDTNLAGSLSLVTIRTQSDVRLIGYIFLGLGSLAFNWLWSLSGYVPKWLAGWGIAGSVICAAASFAFIVSPEFANLIWYLTIGTFELACIFLSEKILKNVTFPPILGNQP